MLPSLALAGKLIVSTRDLPQPCWAILTHHTVGLLEEKGVHPNAGKATGSSSSPDDSKKDKPSLGDRIKAKLHKH